MATNQQPLNPYIAGRAVGGERGFFGRQDVLREVERTLTSPDQNALVLFGQRRIGKTSILLQLERCLPSPPFVPVYFDLMDKARLPLNRVLYELAAKAAPLVGISPPSESEFEGGDDAFRGIFLPPVYEALEQPTSGEAQPPAPRQSRLREFKSLGTGHRFGVMGPTESVAEPASLASARRLVFLFDEFDVLDVAAEEKLPDTAAARAFFPYLRELMAGEPHLGFVFVVGRKTDELSTDFLATFKAARYRRVSVLEPKAARELITLAQREGSLNFTDAAVERILALTAGHPYFIQLLCQILFDRAYDAEPKGVPTVDAADVEAVVPAVLEAGNNAFEWVWDGLPPAERIIFSAIATHADEAGILTEDEIMTILQDAGIRILIKELALAPRTLVEWEMLKEADGGYRFFVELMRRWVAEQKRLEQVKDDLDRVIPLADILYRSGAGFYRAGEVENAIGQLQQALAINPNHLKARLLLGTIYREQGQLEEAVAEFEAAYRYDEVEGRYELVRTLLAHGEALERGGDEDEALKAYGRVLEVSPREQMAQEQQAALWEKRGDRALAESNFEAAIEAYRQARADQKLAQVKAHKLKTELEQAAKEGKAYEAQDEWAKAADVYRRLTELGPDDERWQRALKRVEEELWLAERYAEGAGYVQQEEWDEAQKTLARVINRRPDYRDAAGLLALAVQRGKGQPDPARELRRRLRLGVAGGVGLLLLAVAGVWGYGQIQNQVQAARLTATAIAQATAAEIDAATRVAAAVQGTQLAELRATQTTQARPTATAEAAARATQTAEVRRIVTTSARATQTAQAPTSTPTPTRTLRPTPTPSATIDADPTVYDNFNNPANDGSFNQSQWTYWSDPPNQIAQQDGILRVTQEREKPGQGTRLVARKYNYATLNTSTFFEARLMLSPDKHAGNVQLHLNNDADLPVGETWFSECNIDGSGWANCFDTAWSLQEEQNYNFYDVGGKSVGYGTWHTFRIEVDPASMTFTYYIDGQMTGSHVPVDAEEIKKAKFTLAIGVYGGEVTGYIDDVRIGQIGQ
jgi:tetratricopeptide (TPR) repeat protein